MPFRSRFCRLALMLMLADILALVSAMVITLSLRFDGMAWRTVYENYLHGHINSLPFVIIIYLASFGWFRLYRCAWRFAGTEMLWGVVYANTIALAGMITIQNFVDTGTLPRSVIIMFWMTSIIITGGIRVMLRATNSIKHNGKHAPTAAVKDTPPKQTVIVGAGIDGTRILKAIREDPDLNYQVIGFLDDDPEKRGIYISNVKVLGPCSLLEYFFVDEVIIALPEHSIQKVKECIMKCRKRKIAVKVVPHVRDSLVGKTSLHLVDFSVEDLLRRPAADLNPAIIGGYVKGKRVLVTGAGGSIGSELCRQIASLNPDSLVLVGHGENSIHQIYQQLQTGYPHLAPHIHYRIASVANAARLNQILEEFKPRLVFHAAAHKHVPMMEANECEAVYNNVIGTANLAEICGVHGVERVVLISTDKAANPACVMGATKWLCEQVFYTAAATWTDTAYITVRFGNVLGSRGSVLPAFCEQLKNGGPLTVTHPEMTRYFMTIPEAVRLLLQAGAVGKSGELYILEMGDPIRILDLAEDMIRLCGLEPGNDIQIQFTGIRPGERLHEQLVSAAECTELTPWEGLVRVHKPVYFTPSEITEHVQKLEKAANRGTATNVRQMLYDLVPGFKDAKYSIPVTDTDSQQMTGPSTEDSKIVRSGVSAYHEDSRK